MEVDGSLTALGTKHNTDKAYFHKFTKIYERYLYDKRDKILTMVEVGVLRGSSIKMWEEYLPSAKILGLDITTQYFHERTFGQRVSLEVCDASQKQELESVLQKHGLSSIDLFVEDGSHRVSEQVSTLEAAWKYIRPGGGIYIIEDMHTAVPYLIGRHAHIPHDGGYINQRPTTEERVLFAMYGEVAFSGVPVEEIETISYISNVATKSLTCILTKV